MNSEAMALVDSYFSRLGVELGAMARKDTEETVKDLREQMLEELEAGEGTKAEAEKLIAEFGPPEVLAAQCAELSRSELKAALWQKSTAFSGRFLGMPYELRPPSADRVAMRWWDPLNPHVIVPRLFGIGWTLNFAALAVKLGLIKPDDEDVPFGQVSAAWLSLAWALPLAFAIGLTALIALFQAGLPPNVPVHFTISGEPDGFSSKASALVMPILMTLFGAALAAASWIRRRPPLARVAAGALSISLSAISIGAYGQEVATLNGGSGLAVLFACLFASLLLPFALLVLLSRIGRAAEQRRDIEKDTEKGVS
jgi:hypothetical protein